ncbi:uncharacterized protein EI97DRAFT_458006 [Westerdykella ornata]|uniref:Methyltransferase n=1 Tax=Westerdykella ornata TaxID=318751 RepID=A0A6A6JJL0_WESOR|nr:uncharacterized protein EI97DRAFT_458006 [Westerdykella ornata]KAF2276652.1 hypothetical protein EI97DRAFT_458006 [Westerdykella ornata]
MTAATTTMLFMEPWPPEPSPNNDSIIPSSSNSASDKTNASSQKAYERPYLRGQPTPAFPETTNFTNTAHTVTVHPARAQRDTFTLDKHGFAFPSFPSDSLSQDVLASIRNGEKEVVEERYYPIVEAFVKKETGATRVVIFDHTYRKRDPEVDMEKKENAYKRGQPATVVHCDQSPWGAERRVHRHLGTEAERLLKGRCQIVNVWRPLNGPIYDWPLAVMDYQTLSPSHIHPTNLYSKDEELMGQTVGINHSPEQRWYYLEEQTPDEAILVKIWDNKQDVAKLCAHCSFQHPDFRKAEAPRESIEVRCLVFYEGDVED